MKRKTALKARGLAFQILRGIPRSFRATLPLRILPGLASILNRPDPITRSRRSRYFGGYPISF
jgi:hypothetical protein